MESSASILPTTANHDSLAETSMSQSNYESKWWGYIYDQMMENLQEIVADNQRFYHTNLRDVTGPVLECACGTGIFLLSLLAAGHDIYGFDISQSMLATLKRKA
jgi:2-polyprenyl-3-methyl-5-hydroxy-6-metoxy-1,4-benzoquinol methylase